eukprot:scaffold14.g1073.t1
MLCTCSARASLRAGKKKSIEEIVGSQPSAAEPGGAVGAFDPHAGAPAATRSTSIGEELARDELAAAVGPLVAQVAARLATRALRQTKGGQAPLGPATPAAVAAAALASAEGSGALPPLSASQRSALESALLRAAEDIDSQVVKRIAGGRLPAESSESEAEDQLVVSLKPHMRDVFECVVNTMSETHGTSREPPRGVPQEGLAEQSAQAAEQDFERMELGVYEHEPGGEIADSPELHAGNHSAVDGDAPAAGDGAQVPEGVVDTGPSHPTEEPHSAFSAHAAHLRNKIYIPEDIAIMRQAVAAALLVLLAAASVRAGELSSGLVKPEQPLPESVTLMFNPTPGAPTPLSPGPPPGQAVPSPSPAAPIPSSPTPVTPGAIVPSPAGPAPSYPTVPGAPSSPAVPSVSSPPLSPAVPSSPVVPITPTVPTPPTPPAPSSPSGPATPGAPLTPGAYSPVLPRAPSPAMLAGPIPATPVVPFAPTPGVYSPLPIQPAGYSTYPTTAATSSLAGYGAVATSLVGYSTSLPAYSASVLPTEPIQPAGYSPHPTAAVTSSLAGYGAVATSLVGYSTSLPAYSTSVLPTEPIQPAGYSPNPTTAATSSLAGYSASLPAYSASVLPAPYSSRRMMRWA